jgi:hypothetical protein
MCSEKMKPCLRIQRESTVKKKHNSITYHRTREAQASGTVRLAWEPGDTN